MEDLGEKMVGRLVDVMWLPLEGCWIDVCLFYPKHGKDSPAQESNL